MIPYRGDQFDRFNHGQSNHRPMVFISPQQPQLFHGQGQPTMMYPGPMPTFHQQFQGNPPLLQQNPMYEHNGPRPQQSWILSAPAQPAQMPNFMGSSSFAPSQPKFIGGSAHSQSSFNGPRPMPPPSIGNGTGIPQPPFRGGTAFLKRKSHYLDESEQDPPTPYDHEFPSVMSLSTRSFQNSTMQHSSQTPFYAQNSRYADHNPAHLQLPPALPPPSLAPPPPPPPPMPVPSLQPVNDCFGNSPRNPPWINNDHLMYSTPSLTVDRFQQQLAASQLFQKQQSIPIDSILKEPGRSQRSPLILIVLRGLPGSGKSYVADLIKNEEEEQSKGTNKPKIISIDNYFLTENQQEIKDPKTGKITKTSTMQYEYDPQMEETYRKSLIKLVRKSIDDRFFPFLIVDQNNERIGHFRDFVDYAQANKFQVYFVELNADVESCTKRNIHHRSVADIEQIHRHWEPLPLHYEQLDIRSLLQSDAIDEVEMDDAPVSTAESNENGLDQQSKEDDEECQVTKKCKWDTMMETNLDRLDGVYQRRATSSSPVEKRLSSNNTSLLLPDETVSSNSTENTQSKKKKVRWADIEENALHLHKRAVGFVVGQTEQDWQRMTDSYDPSQKLNQYKYI